MEGLAECYIRGTGVDPDLDEAERWFKKCMACGDSIDKGGASEKLTFISNARKAKASGGEAMFNFAKDLDVYSSGYENSIVWLKMSAGAGYIPAMYPLAMSCLHDSETPDVPAAIALLQKAADRGDNDSKVALAQFTYEGSNGMTKNEKAALKTLQSLSKNGVDKATLCLACIYIDSGKSKLQKKAQTSIEELTKKAGDHDLDLLVGVVEVYLHNSEFRFEHAVALTSVLSVLESKGSVSQLVKVGQAYEAAGLSSYAEQWYKLAMSR